MPVSSVEFRKATARTLAAAKGVEAEAKVLGETELHRACLAAVGSISGLARAVKKGTDSTDTLGALAAVEVRAKVKDVRRCLSTVEAAGAVDDAAGPVLDAAADLDAAVNTLDSLAFEALSVPALDDGVALSAAAILMWKYRLVAAVGREAFALEATTAAVRAPLQHLIRLVTETISTDAESVTGVVAATSRVLQQVLVECENRVRATGEALPADLPGPNHELCTTTKIAYTCLCRFVKKASIWTLHAVCTKVVSAAADLAAAVATVESALQGEDRRAVGSAARTIRSRGNQLSLICEAMRDNPAGETSLTDAAQESFTAIIQNLNVVRAAMKDILAAASDRAGFQVSSRSTALSELLMDAIKLLQAAKADAEAEQRSPEVEGMALAHLRLAVALQQARTGVHFSDTAAPGDDAVAVRGALTGLALNLREGIDRVRGEQWNLLPGTRGTVTTAINNISIYGCSLASGLGDSAVAEALLVNIQSLVFELSDLAVVIPYTAASVVTEPARTFVAAKIHACLSAMARLSSTALGPAIPPLLEQQDRVVLASLVTGTANSAVFTAHAVLSYALAALDPATTFPGDDDCELVGDEDAEPAKPVHKDISKLRKLNKVRPMSGFAVPPSVPSALRRLVAGYSLISETAADIAGLVNVATFENSPARFFAATARLVHAIAWFVDSVRLGTSCLTIGSRVVVMTHAADLVVGCYDLIYSITRVMMTKPVTVSVRALVKASAAAVAQRIRDASFLNDESTLALAGTDGSSSTPTAPAARIGADPSKQIRAVCDLVTGVCDAAAHLATEPSAQPPPASAVAVWTGLEDSLQAVGMAAVSTPFGSTDPTVLAEMAGPLLDVADQLAAACGAAAAASNQYVNLDETRLAIVMSGLLLAWCNYSVLPAPTTALPAHGSVRTFSDIACSALRVEFGAVVAASWLANADKNFDTATLYGLASFGPRASDPNASPRTGGSGGGGGGGSGVGSGVSARASMRIGRSDSDVRRSKRGSLVVAVSGADTADYLDQVGFLLEATAEALVSLDGDGDVELVLMLSSSPDAAVDVAVAAIHSLARVLLEAARAVFAGRPVVDAAVAAARCAGTIAGALRLAGAGAHDRDRWLGYGASILTAVGSFVHSLAAAASATPLSAVALVSSSVTGVAESLKNRIPVDWRGMIGPASLSAAETLALAANIGTKGLREISPRVEAAASSTEDGVSSMLGLASERWVSAFVDCIEVFAWALVNAALSAQEAIDQLVGTTETLASAAALSAVAGLLCARCKAAAAGRPLLRYLAGILSGVPALLTALDATVTGPRASAAYGGKSVYIRANARAILQAAIKVSRALDGGSAVLPTSHPLSARLRFAGKLARLAAPDVDLLTSADVVAALEQAPLGVRIVSGRSYADWVDEAEECAGTVGAELAVMIKSAASVLGRQSGVDASSEVRGYAEAFINHALRLVITRAAAAVTAPEAGRRAASVSAATLADSLFSTRLVIQDWATDDSAQLPLQPFLREVWELARSLDPEDTPVPRPDSPSFGVVVRGGGAGSSGGGELTCSAGAVRTVHSALVSLASEIVELAVTGVQGKIEEMTATARVVLAACNAGGAAEMSVAAKAAGGSVQALRSAVVEAQRDLELCLQLSGSTSHATVAAAFSAVLTSLSEAGVALVRFIQRHVADGSAPAAAELKTHVFGLLSAAKAAKALVSTGGLEAELSSCAGSVEALRSSLGEGVRKPIVDPILVALSGALSELSLGLPDLASAATAAQADTAVGRAKGLWDNARAGLLEACDACAVWPGPAQLQSVLNALDGCMPRLLGLASTCSSLRLTFLFFYGDLYEVAASVEESVGLIGPALGQTKFRGESEANPRNTVDLLMADLMNDGGASSDAPTSARASVSELYALLDEDDDVNPTQDEISAYAAQVGNGGAGGAGGRGGVSSGASGSGVGDDSRRNTADALQLEEGRPQSVMSEASVLEGSGEIVEGEVANTTTTAAATTTATNDSGSSKTGAGTGGAVAVAAVGGVAVGAGVAAVAVTARSSGSDDAGAATGETTPRSASSGQKEHARRSLRLGSTATGTSDESGSEASPVGPLPPPLGETAELAASRASFNATATTLDSSKSSVESPPTVAVVPASTETSPVTTPVGANNQSVNDIFALVEAELADDPSDVRDHRKTATQQLDELMSLAAGDLSDEGDGDGVGGLAAFGFEGLDDESDEEDLGRGAGDVGGAGGTGADTGDTATANTNTAATAEGDDEATKAAEQAKRLNVVGSRSVRNSEEIYASALDSILSELQNTEDEFAWRDNDEDTQQKRVYEQRATALDSLLENLDGLTDGAPAMPPRAAGETGNEEAAPPPLPRRRSTANRRSAAVGGSGGHAKELETSSKLDDLLLDLAEDEAFAPGPATTRVDGGGDGRGAGKAAADGDDDDDGTLDSLLMELQRQGSGSDLGSPRARSGSLSKRGSRLGQQKKAASSSGLRTMSRGGGDDDIAGLLRDLGASSQEGDDSPRLESSYDSNRDSIVSDSAAEAELDALLDDLTDDLPSSSPNTPSVLRKKSVVDRARGSGVGSGTSDDESRDSLDALLSGLVGEGEGAAAGGASSPAAARKKSYGKLATSESGNKRSSARRSRALPSPTTAGVRSDGALTHLSESKTFSVAVAALTSFEGEARKLMPQLAGGEALPPPRARDEAFVWVLKEWMVFERFVVIDGVDTVAIEDAMFRVSVEPLLAAAEAEASGSAALELAARSLRAELDNLATATEMYVASPWLDNVALMLESARRQAAAQRLQLQSLLAASTGTWPGHYGFSIQDRVVSCAEHASDADVEAALVAALQRLESLRKTTVRVFENGVQKTTLAALGDTVEPALALLGDMVRVTICACARVSGNGSDTTAVSAFSGAVEELIQLACAVAHCVMELVVSEEADTSVLDACARAAATVCEAATNPSSDEAAVAAEADATLRACLARIPSDTIKTVTGALQAAVARLGELVRRRDADRLVKTTQAVVQRSTELAELLEVFLLVGGADSDAAHGSLMAFTDELSDAAAWLLSATKVFVLDSTAEDSYGGLADAAAAVATVSTKMSFLMDLGMPRESWRVTRASMMAPPTSATTVNALMSGTAAVAAAAVALQGDTAKAASAATDLVSSVVAAVEGVTSEINGIERSAGASASGIMEILGVPRDALASASSALVHALREAAGSGGTVAALSGHIAEVTLANTELRAQVEAASALLSEAEQGVAALYEPTSEVRALDSLINSGEYVNAVIAVADALDTLLAAARSENPVEGMDAIRSVVSSQNTMEEVVDAALDECGEAAPDYNVIIAMLEGTADAMADVLACFKEVVAAHEAADAAALSASRAELGEKVKDCRLAMVP